MLRHSEEIIQATKAGARPVTMRTSLMKQCIAAGRVPEPQLVIRGPSGRGPGATSLLLGGAGLGDELVQMLAKANATQVTI